MLAGPALFPASSVAATTTGIPTAQLTGSGLTNLVACGSCTYEQFRGPPGVISVNPSFVALAGGVIVRWRLGSMSAGNPVTLRVLRPGPGTTATGAGTGTVRTTAGGVTVYENEHLRIRAGDTIGLNDANNQLFFRTTVDPNDISVLYTPAFADNAPSMAPTQQPARLIQLNADIEADVDGDGFGDETQDGCPQLASTQAPCADLSISKSAGASSFTPGQNLSYTLAVRNNGTRTATSSTLVDTLPTGSSLVSATSSAGACSGTSTVVCSVGNLAVGATAAATLVIRPPAVASITNTASVISALPDPDPANNSASITLRDITTPSVSNVSASPRVSRLGSALARLARKRPPIGTTISWQLSEPATTTVSFGQTRRGRKKGKRCIVGRRTGSRCSFLAIKGSLVVSANAGLNKLRFQGRLSTRRKLAPGSYTVLISARDAAGNVSSTRSTRITLVR